MGLFGPPNVAKMKAAVNVHGLIRTLGYSQRPSIPNKSEQECKADETVRMAAATALAELGTVAVEPLIEALEHNDDKVCTGAASALGKIGDRRAIEPLINGLKMTEKTTTLGTLKTSNVRRNTAIQTALVAVGLPAVEPLISALQHGDSGQGRAVATVLGCIGDFRAVDPLIVALKDADSDVRSSSASALGQLGDARAVHPLITALEKERQSIAVSDSNQAENDALSGLFAEVGLPDPSRVPQQAGGFDAVFDSFFGPSLCKACEEALSILYHNSRLANDLKKAILAVPGMNELIADFRSTEGLAAEDTTNLTE